MSGSQRRVLMQSSVQQWRSKSWPWGVTSSEWALRVISIAVDFQFSVHHWCHKHHLWKHLKSSHMSYLWLISYHRLTVVSHSREYGSTTLVLNLSQYERSVSVTLFSYSVLLFLGYVPISFCPFSFFTFYFLI